MRRQAKDFAPHLDRYVFAMQYCQKQTVLELGGKSGYGADILAFVSGQVTVVDNVESQLKQAKRHETILMDLNEDFPEGIWDSVVAFEIIEHVEDPDKFVKAIKKHLVEDGKLVFSVPHMKPHVDHVTLFNEKSIKALISKYFKLEEFYVQDSYGISGEKFTKYPLSYVGVARA